MRRAWMVAVVAMAVFLPVGCGSSEPGGGAVSAPGSGAGEGATVVTKLLKFDPEKITVKAGDTVTWEAGDGIGHTVTTGTFTVGGDGLRTAEQPDGRVDMPLSQGQKVSFTFPAPGVYSYYCSIHKGMSGEVEVTP